MNPAPPAMRRRGGTARVHVPVEVEGNVVRAGSTARTFEAGSVASLLGAYLELIRALRDQRRARTIELRSVDIDALATHLGMHGTDVVEHLAELMGATRSQRVTMVGLFGAGALVIGLAGSGAVGHAVSTSHSTVAVVTDAPTSLGHPAPVQVVGTPDVAVTPPPTARRDDHSPVGATPAANELIGPSASAALEVPPTIDDPPADAGPAPAADSSTGGSRRPSPPPTSAPAAVEASTTPTAMEPPTAPPTTAAPDGEPVTTEPVITDIGTPPIPPTTTEPVITDIGTPPIPPTTGPVTTEPVVTDIGTPPVPVLPTTAEPVITDIGTPPVPPPT